MANEDGVPDLDELRRELEAVGMVVVPFGDEIHVRRSTLEYIKVRVEGGVLRCEACIGGMSQARMTWLLMAAEAIEIPVLLMQSAGKPWGLVVAFAGILGFAFHALRYTLAETTISRVQSVWLDLRARHRVAPVASPMLRPSPVTQALPAGAVATHQESMAHHIRTRN